MLRAKGEGSSQKDPTKRTDRKQLKRLTGETLENQRLSKIDRKTGKQKHRENSQMEKRNSHEDGLYPESTDVLCGGGGPTRSPDIL